MTETRQNLPIILIVALVVGFLAYAAIFFDDPEPPAGPCDEATLNAPYESGSEYWDRDQRAERTDACLKSRLDD